MTEKEGKELVKFLAGLSPAWGEKTRQDVKTLIDLSETAEEFLVSLITYLSNNDEKR